MSYSDDCMKALSSNIRNLNDNLNTIRDNNYIKTIELILNILENEYCGLKEKVKYEALLQKHMTPEIAENLLNKNKQR